MAGYDAVVVGARCAGSALAAQLARGVPTKDVMSKERLARWFAGAPAASGG